MTMIVEIYVKMESPAVIYKKIEVSDLSEEEIQKIVFEAIDEFVQQHVKVKIVTAKEF
jgi:predicted transcriptional regulator